jgi:hypothetical protein
MADTCQCRSGTHGHEPGKCKSAATESDKMCKSCHDKAAKERKAG